MNCDILNNLYIFIIFPVPASQIKSYYSGMEIDDTTKPQNNKKKDGDKKKKQDKKSEPPKPKPPKTIEEALEAVNIFYVSYH